MHRKCSNCQKEFAPQELARPESMEMEAQRKELGLQGVLFRYYRCAACGFADIFVDIHPLAEESAEEFDRRKRELEEAVRQLHEERVEGVDVLLVERHREERPAGGP
jgi:hypothetical protein